jgi:hypothetical protein
MMSVLAGLLPALDLHHDIIVIVQMGSPGWSCCDERQRSLLRSDRCQA